MKPSHLTPEELEAKTCGSKVRYMSRAKAKRARKHFQNKYGDKMSAYLCIFCGFYHIGHKYKQIEEVRIDVSRPEGTFAD